MEPASARSSLAVLVAMPLVPGLVWLWRVEEKVTACPSCGREPAPRPVFAAPAAVADAIWRLVGEERWRSLIAMKGDLALPDAAPPGAFACVLYDCEGCGFVRVEMRPPPGGTRGGTRSRELSGESARVAIAHLRTPLALSARNPGVLTRSDPPPSRTTGEEEKKVR